MDFWTIFWSTYPGAVVAASIFFARGIRHYQQTAMRQSDQWNLSAIAWLSLLAGVVWPIASIPFAAMLWISKDEAKAQRIERQSITFREAKSLMIRNPDEFEGVAHEVLAKLRVRRDIERTKARQKFHDDWTKAFNEGSGNRPST